MFTQKEADRLMATVKILKESAGAIQFPISGDALRLEATSEDGREAFHFDVNRRGQIKISKCTYQERVSVEVLLRLDIDGPDHTNPDGDIVPCPHLHVFKEGYGDKWAFALPVLLASKADLGDLLSAFLKYCNVQNIPDIQTLKCFDDDSQ